MRPDFIQGQKLTMYVRGLLLLLFLGVLVTVIVVPILLTRKSSGEEVFLDSSIKLPVVDDRPLSTFEIHTPKNSSRHRYTEVENLLNRIQEGSKITFFVHGYCSPLGGNTWSEYLELKDNLFKVDKEFTPDYVILVDWMYYCRGYAPYGIGDWWIVERVTGFKQANRNSQRIAKELAHVIYHMVLRKKINPSNIHLIGFSLGGQSVAISAWRLSQYYGFYKKIGRITGIDPANPQDFSDPYLVSTLDASDGQFVDIIHTNTRRFGQPEARGHLDFYINGGQIQPGCKSFFGFKEDICSHTRSYELFALSLTDRCQIRSSNCKPNENQILEPGMESCPPEVKMGFYAIQTPRARGIYSVSVSLLKNVGFSYCSSDTLR